MRYKKNACAQRGKPVARGLMALLLILAFLAACGSVGWAEINAQVVNLPGTYSEPWRVTIFSGEMPGDIEKALTKAGFSGYTCYSGAMLEKMANQNDQSPASALVAQALVAVEKGGERILLGMTWKEKEWGVATLGDKALLPDREFTISAADADNDSVWYVPIRFTITYPLADGGSETYGLICEAMQMGDAPLWNIWYQRWCVNDYMRVDADGQGVAIMTAGGALRVINLPYDKMETESYYPAYFPTALEYMDSIARFPASEAEAKSLAETSFAGFEGSDLAVATGGVNLRKYPTTASQILAKMRPGALVHVLGEEKGWDAPWYHVRIGNLEGFIAGTYLALPQGEDFARALFYSPPTVARAPQPCTLREAPEDEAPGAELPADTLMHVVADVGDEWLYVMVPKGEIGWEMDVDGIGGYVLASEVVQGAYVGTSK